MKSEMKIALALGGALVFGVAASRAWRAYKLDKVTDQLIADNPNAF